MNGTVEFQPLCSPDLSLLFVERAQDTASSSCHNPAELRALLTRVYQSTWTCSLWIFEKIGAALVRRPKACTKAVFSSSTEMADRILPLIDTQQKHVI